MIYNVIPVNNYQGNNSTTTFDFDFYVENSNQLKVYLFDSNNLKSQLTYNIDYSINEFKNQNGSYITYPLNTSSHSILSADEHISLILDLPISQETQYNNSSLLNLSTLEYSFDYLTRLVQIISRKCSLCVKVDECSSVTADQLLASIDLNVLSATNAATSAVNAKNTVTPMYNYINENYNKFLQIDALSTGKSNISLDNLSDLGNSKLNFEVFCVNSGAVNSNGEPDCLTYSGAILTLNATNTDLVATNAAGKTLTITANKTFDCSTLADGTYNVFINSENGNLSLLLNTVYRNKKEPTSPSANAVWFNTNLPYCTKKYDGSTWVDFSDIYIGSCTVASGVITSVNIFPYNYNGTTYKPIEHYFSGRSFYRVYLMWDTSSNALAKYCHQGGYCSPIAGYRREIYLLKEFIDDCYDVQAMHRGLPSGADSSTALINQYYNRLEIYDGGYGLHWQCEGRIV